MILFFDSGIGGLSYLRAYRACCPHADTTYFADHAFLPYGERHPDEVRARVTGVVTALAAREPFRAVVLACNTASVVALAALRAVVSCPVVGTVPAVKPAAEVTQSGHIAILATNRTLRDAYTDELVDHFARFARVTRVGLPRLVEAAERYCSNRDDVAIDRLIATEVRPQIGAEVDVVVLACTHFVQFREHFARVLGAGVRVVDSLDGVTRRVVTVAGRGDEEGGRERYLVSGTPASTPARWCGQRWEPFVEGAL